MKLCHGLVVALFCLLVNGAKSSLIYGQEVPPNSEILDLIRKTQDLAAQSQAELKRSREQNERLQQLLEQTNQELVRLREEVNLLRSNATTHLPSPYQLSARATAAEQAQEKSDNAEHADPEKNLRTRLMRLEDQVGLNTAQLTEQAQTKVESESRFKVRLFGTVLDNTYFNTADTSDSAVPASAPSPYEAAGHNLGATLRQTQFGFSMTGPKLGAARLSADIDFDFFGGTSTSYSANVLGALRMRTASVRLDGQRTSLALGLMAPLISSLNPTSFAAVYYPSMGESGNLWQWIPQMTVEHRIPAGEDRDLILQGGLIMPFGENIHGTTLRGGPGYETRLAFSREADPDMPLEIGVGGYFQPRRLGPLHTANSYAVTSDWQIPLTRHMEWSGEAFYGQGISLSEQSGTDIANAFSYYGSLSDALTRVRGVRSTGGWTQLSIRPNAKLEFNTAFGLEDPWNRDIFGGLYQYDVRLKNETFSINSIYRFRSNFLVSAEYRRLWTLYATAQTTNNHFNLAVGYLF